MRWTMPPTWRTVKLGVCLQRRKETVLPSRLSDAFVGLVGLEDIQDGGRGGITIRSTKPQDIESLKTLFFRGDILYGKLRPYLNKVGIVQESGLCSTEIWAFSPTDLVNSQFAAFFLASSLFVDRVESLTKGANLPRLDTEAFDSIEIPLPPLSEQQHIVQILQHAEEIRRLRTEAEAKTAELIPAIFSNTFLAPYTASSWKETTLAKIAAKHENSIRTGPFGSDLLHSEFVDHGIPVLGIDNAVANRFRWGERRYISAAKYTDLSRFRVHPNDVMITIMGTVGRVAIAPSDLTEAISTKHLCVITPDATKILPSFLWATLLHNPSVRSQTKAVGKGAIMEGWNSKIIRSLRFALPPLKLQWEFDAQVQAAFQIEDALDASPLTALLRASLSSHAFSGQLTANWREARVDELTIEARDRDDALKKAGAAIPRSRRATDQEIQLILDQPKDGIYSELNHEQRDLLIRVQQRVGGARNIRYFSAQSLSESLDGPLRKHPQAIQGHLAVFAARGLIIPVSREEQTEDTGQFVFANSYRLPLQDKDQVLADDKGNPIATDTGAGILGDKVIGDYTRLRELQRLAAQLEKAP
jgi:type I restriction enzyme S subunit